MKRLKYVLIAAVVIGLIVAGAGCLGQPAKPESEEVDYYGQCLANAVRAEGDKIYVEYEDAPGYYLNKAVFVEGTIKDSWSTLGDNCEFVVVDEDEWPWWVDTLGLCPGVESNCWWVSKGDKVKVWGYIMIKLVEDDEWIPEIVACEIEKR